MYVHNLVGTEDHPVYQQLAAENLGRQYSFLRSLVHASINLQHPVLSIQALNSLNYHAIACLHTNAGQFRPCAVYVGKGEDAYEPPPFHQVGAHMQMFTNRVNRLWENADPVWLAALVLWEVNRIHPFINGNGRTARAACHLVLCMKLGGWLVGDPILPELLRRDRAEYVAALKAADASLPELDLSVLHALLQRLLKEQLASADAPAVPAAAEAVEGPEA